MDIVREPDAKNVADFGEGNGGESGGLVLGVYPSAGRKRGGAEQKKRLL